MLRKTLAILGMLAMASCTPTYATELKMTAQHCTTVKVLARQIIIDLQQGTSAYQIMHQLNERPMSDYGTDGEAAKLYLQINTSAFSRNVRKGFRVNQILKVVEKDCNMQVEADT